MHISQLKTGLKVKIDIKEGMKVLGTDTPEDFVSQFFGNKPNIQKWMKEYNLFEITKIDNMAGGIFNSGESWQFVVMKPVLLGGITEEDFSYETEDEEGNSITLSNITIENYFLEVNE